MGMIATIHAALDADDRRDTAILSRT